MYISRRRLAAFTVPELLAIALIMLVLLVLILPTLRHNRRSANEARRTGIAATLTRIERAKTTYVEERHLKQGDSVTMTDLVRRGYLDAEPGGGGILYSVNAVGRPVTYEFTDADVSPHRATGPDSSDK